jgi:hypothetical protein
MQVMLEMHLEEQYGPHMPGQVGRSAKKGPSSGFEKHLVVRSELLRS